MSQIVRITTTTACLAGRAEIANTLGSRLVGLLGRDRLPSGTGLVLQTSNSIHTLFMRFPIDVIFLDDQQRIVATAVRLQPFTIALIGVFASVALATGLVASHVLAQRVPERRRLRELVRPIDAPAHTSVSLLDDRPNELIGRLGRWVPQLPSRLSRVRPRLEAVGYRGVQR